ncbi:MAG: hypothetical protein AABZ36_04350 [Nitrospirota bacterium]
MEDLFRNLPITSYAYKKAHMYADIASEIACQRVEVYGYLIGPRTVDDALVHDVYLSHRQVASPTRCTVDQEGVLLTSEAIRQEGNRIIGWWHSHKGLTLQHHSDHDDTNFRVLKYALFNNNKKSLGRVAAQFGKAPYSVQIENDEVRIISGDLAAGTLVIKLASDLNISNLAVKGLTIERHPTAGFAYSLILNDNISKPYCEIAVQTDDGIRILKGVPISLIAEQEERRIDLELMRGEILERVTYAGKHQSQPAPTIKDEAQKEIKLEDKVRAFVTKNRRAINLELSDALVAYAKKQEGIKYGSLLGAEDARQFRDNYTYFLSIQRELMAGKSHYDKSTINELKPIVEELIDHIQVLASNQISRWLDYSAQINSSRIQIDTMESQSKGRSARKLRKQKEKIKLEYTRVKESITIWESIKTVKGDEDGTGS